MDREASIGVFDSGIGGLTVVREIMRQIPNESIIYFGDTARVPYGSKSKETIITYSRQIVEFLRTKHVKAVVIACNTASAFALETLKKEIDLPIIGVIHPGAKVAAETTKNNRVGIIGTEGTVNSKIYTTTLSKLSPNVQVFGKACPLFVPLVEEGWLKDPVTYQVAQRYLEELKGFDIDTLVLGCTHYPLLRDVVGQVMGEGVSLVNPAYETAMSLKQVLDYNDLRSQTEGAKHKFFVSDGAEKFKAFANTILPCEVEETKDINIEQY